MAGTAVHQVCFHLLSVGYAHDYVRIALFAVGYLWLLAIPSSQFGQRTYIDENALQPGQVCRTCPKRFYERFTDTLTTALGAHILELERSASRRQSAGGLGAVKGPECNQ